MDGSIASVKFNSSETIENILNGADPAVLKKVESDLAQQVYKSTMHDITKIRKKNKLVDAILAHVDHGRKAQTREQEALDVLEELD